MLLLSTHCQVIVLPIIALSDTGENEKFCKVKNMISTGRRCGENKAKGERRGKRILTFLVITLSFR